MKIDIKIYKKYELEYFPHLKTIKSSFEIIEKKLFN